MPGLRREEVALLAGVSVDYYTRLERGNLSGVSETVLEALARALQLDDAERAHLFDLARATQARPRARRRRAPEQVRPSVQRMLDAMTAAPAFVRNGRMDILAANGWAAPSTRRCTRPAAPAQHGVVRLPRSSRSGLLRRLGAGRDRCGRDPAGRGRAESATTGASGTSSASCRRRASSSARGGPRTTSAATTPASSASIIPSSASSR